MKRSLQLLIVILAASAALLLTSCGAVESVARSGKRVLGIPDAPIHPALPAAAMSAPFESEYGAYIYRRKMEALNRLAGLEGGGE